MKAFVAALLFCVSTAVGRTDVFKLPGGGSIELFPVGRWKVASEDVGELKIILDAADPKTNARAIYSIGTEGSDDFPTEEKLFEQMQRVASRLLQSGDFVERKPSIKAFYPPQGFGFYAVMTDRKLVGKPSIPGDYKFFTLGMIRMGPGAYLKVQIMADDETSEPYQQLLGMAEGAVYKAR